MTPSRAVRAEAAAWLAKLYGPERSAALEDDFRSWLGADPEHAAAFEHMTEIWDHLGSVSVGGLPRLAVNVQRRSSGRRSFVAVAATCALAAIVFAAGWLLRPETVTTKIGEQRIVTLEDGTRVALNSDTELDVSLEPERRNVRLRHGEAFFEVAHDASRPFTVRAGDRVVTALGTSFAVRYDDSGTAVTLIEGVVSVSAPNAAPVKLQPGQRLAAAANTTPRIDTGSADAAVAWRRGEIILDETSLRAAVAEMNRYERRPLKIDDDIAQLPVSGIYRTGDARGFAAAVAAVYDLGVIEEQGQLRLTRRR